ACQLSVAGSVLRVPSMISSRRIWVMEPNAPYALTRCQRLKLAFISCRDENKFRSGSQLNTTSQINTTAMTMNHHTGDCTCALPSATVANRLPPQPGQPPPTSILRNESLIPEKAIRIVIQFSQA